MRRLSLDKRLVSEWETYREQRSSATGQPKSATCCWVYLLSITGTSRTRQGWTNRLSRGKLDGMASLLAKWKGCL